jgi:hypothetical protein
MQRTLKREFKELEIVKREATEVSYSIAPGEIQLARGGFLVGRSRGGGVGGGQPFSAPHLPAFALPGLSLSGKAPLFLGGEPASVFPHTLLPCGGCGQKGG